MLKRKSNELIGVDIGHKNVKMTHLSTDGKSFKLENFTIKEIPENTIQEGDIQNTDALIKVIGECIRSLRVSKINMALSVHPSSTMSSIVSVYSGLNPIEKEEQILNEINAIVPIPVEQLNIDFVEIGPNQKDANLSDYLVVAAKKEFIETLDQVFESNDSQLKIIDIDSYVYPRLILDKPEGVYCVLDIGANKITINVYKDDQVLYTKDQAHEQFFYEEINQYINDKKNSLSEQNQMMGKSKTIDYNEIYELFEDESSQEDERFVDIVLRHREELSENIIRTVGFYNMHHQNNQVTRILLTGGMSNMPSICRIIHENLEIPCDPLKTVEDVEIKDSIKPFINERTLNVLSKSIGVAKRCLYKGNYV